MISPGSHSWDVVGPGLESRQSGPSILNTPPRAALDLRAGSHRWTHGQHWVWGHLPAPQCLVGVGTAFLSLFHPYLPHRPRPLLSTRGPADPQLPAAPAGVTVVPHELLRAFVLQRVPAAPRLSPSLRPSLSRQAEIFYPIHAPWAHTSSLQGWQPVGSCSQMGRLR